MQQQTLDLLIDRNQPLMGIVEFYESNHVVQEALTCRDFLKLIETNREFFGGSVVIIRNGIFLRESFRERLDAWLATKNSNNQPKAA